MALVLLSFCLCDQSLAIQSAYTRGGRQLLRDQQPDTLGCFMESKKHSSHTPSSSSSFSHVLFITSSSPSPFPPPPSLPLLFLLLHFFPHPFLFLLRFLLCFLVFSLDLIRLPLSRSIQQASVQLCYSSATETLLNPLIGHLNLSGSLRMML